MLSLTNQRQKKQKTVKAFDIDIALINERAKGLSCSAADIIHSMCEDLRRQVYLQELGEVYDSVRNDPEKWAAFQKEQEVWDGSLSDGLDDAY